MGTTLGREQRAPDSSNVSAGHWNNCKEQEGYLPKVSIAESRHADGVLKNKLVRAANKMLNM
jgi:hypothetical protein